MNTSVTTPQTRSSTPRVVGVLMIMLGCLGFAIASKKLVSLTELSWSSSIVLTGLAASLSLFQAGAGILAVLYLPRAPKLAAGYGISAIALMTVTWAIRLLSPREALYQIPEDRHLRALPFHLVNILHDVFDVIATLTSYILIAWPIVVIWLMTRPSSIAACRAKSLWRLPRARTASGS